ncbi:MAG: trypsin-like peptidase domain-containing protein, partial [Planctomycetaceae bacterium]
MRTFVVTILLMLIPAFANAQVGKDSALWQWSADGQHHNAVVEVSLNGATGTGVIVHVNRDKPVGKGFQGYCLTAHHVVEKDESKREIQLKYHTGRIASRCKIVAFDKEHDLAILWVWVPNDIKPVAIAKQNIQASQRLEYAGLGGGSKIENGLRHFYGNS